MLGSSECCGLFKYSTKVSLPGLIVQSSVTFSPDPTPASGVWVSPPKSSYFYSLVFSGVTSGAGATSGVKSLLSSSALGICFFSAVSCSSLLAVITALPLTSSAKAVLCALSWAFLALLSKMRMRPSLSCYTSARRVWRSGIMMSKIWARTSIILVKAVLHIWSCRLVRLMLFKSVQISRKNFSAFSLSSTLLLSRIFRISSF